MPLPGITRLSVMFWLLVAKYHSVHFTSLMRMALYNKRCPFKVYLPLEARLDVSTTSIADMCAVGFGISRQPTVVPSLPRQHSRGPMASQFVWLWPVVNDRKFLVKTVFFSHTNQSTVFFYQPTTKRTSQPNMVHSR